MSNFKIGDAVCANRTFADLTKGRVYTILDIDSGNIKILDDQEVYWYGKENFDDAPQDAPMIPAGVQQVLADATKELTEFFRIAKKYNLTVTNQYGVEINGDI